MPWPLWIDFRIEGNDDGTCRLFTTGMKSFDKPEIEIPRSQRDQAEVFDFACSIADYIITTNPRIEDGHTVGRSDAEAFAEHGPVDVDPKKTVLNLISKRLTRRTVLVSCVTGRMSAVRAKTCSRT